MFQATEEQKAKYYDKVNNVLANDDEMIKKINHELLVYGICFFKFSTGEITLDYIKNERVKLITTLKNINQGAFSKTVDDLKAIKEAYIKECFPVLQTTDKLELDFIEKELAVMSYEEMQDFYKSNFLDKNKVRLFDIEVKKRENISNGANASIGTLKRIRETYTIEDDVMKTIDERIKFFDGSRQVASGALILVQGFNSKGKLIPKVISHDQVVEFTQEFYRRQATKKINIMEML